VDFRIHPTGPIQSLAGDRYLSETIDTCDFRVAHDNGGHDDGVAADDDDNDADDDDNDDVCMAPPS
jgi:hypothetical protein